MKNLHVAAWILLVAGGLNWLLVAFNFNLASSIFGGVSWLEKLIYILVGLSAVYEIVNHKKTCKNCEKVVTAQVQ